MWANVISQKLCSHARLLDLHTEIIWFAHRGVASGWYTRTACNRKYVLVDRLKCIKSGTLETWYLSLALFALHWCAIVPFPTSAAHLDNMYSAALHTPVKMRSVLRRSNTHHCTKLLQEVEIISSMPFFFFFLFFFYQALLVFAIMAELCWFSFVKTTLHWARRHRSSDISVIRPFLQCGMVGININLVAPSLAGSEIAIVSV